MLSYTAVQQAAALESGYVEPDDAEQHAAKPPQYTGKFPTEAELSELGDLHLLTSTANNSNVSSWSSETRPAPFIMHDNALYGTRYRAVRVPCRWHCAPLALRSTLQMPLYSKASPTDSAIASPTLPAHLLKHRACNRALSVGHTS